MQSFALLAVAALVSGLPTPGALQKLGGVPPVAPAVSAPVVADATDLTLPVMRYLLTPDDERLLGQAHGVLVDRCFDRFGIAAPSLPEAVPPPVTRTERRYGLTDAVLAATSGYHLTTSDTEKAAIGMSPDQELVLFGSPTPDTVVQGEPVPAEGCSGEAIRELGELGSAELSQQVDVRSVVLAGKDARVRDAFAAWASCMAERGHTYTMPWDPPNDARFTGPTPADTEAAVASDDVECKSESNVAGVWFAVDAALQTVMIDRHAAEFADIAADNSRRLDRARSILADSPAP